MKINKQKIIKTLFFISIIITIVLAGNICFASAGAGAINTTGVSIDIEKTSDLKPMFQNILGLVQTIGSGISVIIIIAIGIKYMYSSTEEKANYKQTMTYYLIGAILLFSSVNVVSIIYEVFWT